jgi:hypothetical protein
MSHTTQTTTLVLTRRGRTVVSTIVASAVIAVGLLMAGPGAQAGADSSSAAPVYTVLSGETLWTIAEDLAPQQDPRVTIDQLMRANDLTSAEITPGDVLLLPSGF